MIIPCLSNRVKRTYLGGHRIDRLRKMELPDGYRPEEWAASLTATGNPDDPAEGLSKTRDGRLLADIIREKPEYLGGLESLPILLKLLDASERLAVQAHPTAEFARENLGSRYGKAECWYVISTDPGAHVYLGFREGVTREDWIDCFERQDIPEMLSMMHRIELSPGDVWYVDGGVPHAIGGNCLVAELQEPSDLMVVTERITPGGRVLPERRIHCGLGFERMFDVFDYTTYTPDRLREKFYRRKVCPQNSVINVIGSDLTDKFRLDECRTDSSLTIGEGEYDSPIIGAVIEGEGAISDRDGSVNLSAGDSFFIAAGSGELRIAGNLRLLIAAPAQK